MEKLPEFVYVPPDPKKNDQEIEPSRVLGELWADMKNRLDVSLGKLFRKESSSDWKDAWDEKFKESLDLNTTVREYYQSLVPNSLHPGDREYVHEERQSTELYNLSDMLKQAKVDQSEDFEQFFNEKEDGAVKENIIMHEGAPLKVEVKSSVWKQDGGENVFSEVVVNSHKDGLNRANASLTIRNLKTKKVLDFTQLLPSGVRLAPSFLEQSEEDISESGELISHEYPVDLETYHGPSTPHPDTPINIPIKSDVMQYDPINKKILYGNVLMKGGSISLLHEISHAWQEAHGLQNAGYHYKTYVDLVTKQLLLLTAFDRALKNKNMTPEMYEKVTTELKNILHDQNITVIEKGSKDNVVGKQSQKEGELIPYTFTSPLLLEYLKDFERQERDAWAHALRVMNHLRKQGFDIEPELRTVADVRAIIDPCLRSYQKNAEWTESFEPEQVRFLRGKTSSTDEQ